MNDSDGGGRADNSSYNSYSQPTNINLPHGDNERFHRYDMRVSKISSLIALRWKSHSFHSSRFAGYFQSRPGTSYASTQGSNSYNGNSWQVGIFPVYDFSFTVDIWKGHPPLCMHKKVLTEMSYCAVCWSNITLCPNTALNPRHSRGRAHLQKRCRQAGFYLGISSSSKTLGGQVCSTAVQSQCSWVFIGFTQAQEVIMSTLGQFPTTSTQPWQATGLILRPILTFRNWMYPKSYISATPTRRTTITTQISPSWLQSLSHLGFILVRLLPPRTSQTFSEGNRTWKGFGKTSLEGLKIMISTLRSTWGRYSSHSACWVMLSPLICLIFPVL